MTVSKPTVAQVRSIIDTALSDGALQGVIDDAALLAENCVKSYVALRQIAIIKWLAAHMVASMSGSAGGAATLGAMALGDANESYVRATMGEGLKGTLYGQQALSLDLNGCLASLGKQRAFMRVL